LVAQKRHTRAATPHGTHSRYTEAAESVPPHDLILVEHLEVITCGRRTRREELRVGASELRARGIELYEVERGGGATYHGPGQLVAYPILDLSRLRRADLGWYLRGLEQVVIGLLERYGIRGRQRQGLTGVWIGERKIASIGIAVKRWVTFHGLAINVSTRLERFDLIVPCGLKGVEMTSMERELKTGIDMAEVRESFVELFCDKFKLSARWLDFPWEIE